MTARSQGPAAPRRARTASEPPRQQMGRGARIASMLAGVVIAALAVVYCVGCIYFYQRFWPNTYIGDANVSSMAASDAKTALEQASKTRTVTVSGQGVSFTLTGENAGLTLNVDTAVSNALAETASWEWPVQVVRAHDASDVLSTSFDTDLLRSTIEAQLQAFNSMASDPTDAFLYFDGNTQSYQINPGSMGTKLDVDSVMQTVMDALTNKQDHAALTSANLVQQNVRGDDERLLAAQQQANSYLGCNYSLTVQGNVVATVDASVVQAWVTVNDDYSVTLDEGQLTAWFEVLEDQVDTINQTRYYTRPNDGKEITVTNSGNNNYGWNSDGATLLQMIKDAVYNGTQGSDEVPFKQTAAVWVQNGADWGNTYIDIDLSEQHVYYFVDGEVVWESNCMTGLANTHDTPPGVYQINSNMRTNTKLIAVDIDPTTGKPEYEVEVKYWMPFIGDLYALHDNPGRDDDQSAYGGDYYTTQGSHGCVNLPTSWAGSLYSMLSNGGVGTPVVVHW